MMYLSALLIDIGNNPDRPRPGRLWLRNMYRVHQRLCMAFPSASRVSTDPNYLQPYVEEDFASAQVHVTRREHAGFLFRVDSTAGRGIVTLVQSAVEPNWEYAFHNAMHLLAAPPQVKPFEPIFAQEQLRFRLRANPTKRLPAGTPGEKRDGKRVQLFGEEQQLAWLRRQGEQHGFMLIDCRVSSVETQCSRKAVGPEMRHQAVTFDGLLQVTDPAAFRAALESGIGPGKGLGFGLLLVARG